MKVGRMNMRYFKDAAKNITKRRPENLKRWKQTN